MPSTNVDWLNERGADIFCTVKHQTLKTGFLFFFFFNVEVEESSLEGSVATLSLCQVIMLILALAKKMAKFVLEYPFFGWSTPTCSCE